MKSGSLMSVTYRVSETFWLTYSMNSGDTSIEKGAGLSPNVALKFKPLLSAIAGRQRKDSEVRAKAFNLLKANIVELWKPLAEL